MFDKEIPKEVKSLFPKKFDQMEKFEKGFSYLKAEDDPNDIQRPLHECSRGHLKCLENGFGVYMLWKGSFSQVIPFCPICGNESPSSKLNRHKV